MRLQPIVYTADTGSAIEWYTTVLGTDPSYRSEAWTTFEIGGATLAIHLAEQLPDGSRIHVSLVAAEPLEDLVARLSTAGIEPVEAIVQQPFGRSVLFRDPDGLPVQINEHR